MTMLLLLVVGCSDDPTSSKEPTKIPTGISEYSDSLEAWVAVVNGSDYDNYAYFSLSNKDYDDANWDIGFRRTAVILNGGESSTGEDTKGASLGAVSFVDVTIDDTTGVSWISDNVSYEIDEWFIYNPQTFTLKMTQYVYSMVDASGEHYLKFRIDSLTGIGPPPDMGTVHITYYYQTELNSTDLSGATTTASIVVEEGNGFFDFSSGTQVEISDSENSLDWDLCFSNYIVKQNSGPNGIGSCAAFQAFTELEDPTDIDGFTAQPAAPLFADILSSALTDWYNYNPTLHLLETKGEVYLIQSGDSIFKLQIISYYQNIGGTASSAYYTINFVRL